MNRIGSARFAFLALFPLSVLIMACDRSPTGPGHGPDMARVEIIDRGQTERPVVATWTPGGGWTGSLPNISLASPNQRVSLGVRIFDEDNDPILLSEAGPYSVRWSLAPGAPTGIIVTNDSRGERFHGDHVYIYGNAAGSTQIQFLLWDIDHSDGATTPIGIQVVN
jgi:hypothetical protein